MPENESLISVDHQTIPKMDIIERTAKAEPHPRGGFEDILDDDYDWMVTLPDGTTIEDGYEIIPSPDHSQREPSAPELNDRHEKAAIKETRRKLGARAIYGAVGIGVTAAIMAPNVKGIADNAEAFTIGTIFDDGHIRTVSANVNIQPRVTPFDNIMVTGGNGQPTAPLGEMIAKGYVGPNAVSNDYFASMSPWASPIGAPTTADSINDGAPNLVDFYHANHARGENTEFVGYSLGTMVTYDALQRIRNENGGVWPDDLHVIIAGAPQIHGGILGPDSPWAGFGTIGLGVGRTSEHPFPPGTVVYYFHDDVYANSGNENVLTMLHDAFGLIAGDHELPDINNPNLPHRDFVDKDGVIHRVYYHENYNDVFINAIEQKLGIKIMDTASANAAMNALFPHNDDPNSTVQPEADVRAAMTYGAIAIDRQIDPSGNFRLFEDIVANMPDEWKQILNSDWNGLNHIANAVAEAVNDPSKIPQAIATVTQELNKMLNGFSQFVNGHPIQQIEKMGVGTLSDTIYQFTGVDVRPQLTSLTEKLHQSAVNYIEQQQAQARLQTEAKARVSINPQTPSAPAALPLPDLKQVIPSAPNVLPNIPIDANANADSTIVNPAPVLTLPVVPAPELPNTPTFQAPAPWAPIEIAPPVIDIPAPAPAPVIDIPAPAPVAAPAPAPIEPVYVAPAPMPVVPAPAPVFEAPAPAPVIDIPVPAPAPAPVFTPAPADSIPAPSAPRISIPFFGGNRSDSTPRLSPAPALVVPDGITPLS